MGFRIVAGGLTEAFYKHLHLGSGHGRGEIDHDPYAIKGRSGRGRLGKRAQGDAATHPKRNT